MSIANLSALAAMFARVTGATSPVDERTDGAERTVYRDDAGRAVIEAWRVAGMGHAWSGGDPRGTHTFPAGPDTTARMLDFLLPGARPPADRSKSRADGHRSERAPPGSSWAATSPVAAADAASTAPGPRR